MMVWLIGVGAVAVLAAFYAYGRYLERHPEKSNVGRAVAERMSETSKQTIEDAIAQTYAEAYEDGIEAARARVSLVRDGCPTCQHEPIDLDALDDRDPSERWTDLDN